MASQRTIQDVQRSAEELTEELDRLRAAHGGRIPPEAFARFKSRAGELRAEAIRRFLDAAGTTAAAESRRIFDVPRDEEEDAPSRG